MSSTNTLTVRLALNGLANVEGGLARLKSGVSGLGKVVGGVAAALAAKASFEAIGGAALAVAKLGGELSDLKARTGAGIGSLVVLQRAFADSGAGAENVGKAFGLMQRELIEAAEKGGPAAEALAQIGLNATELLRLNPDAQFMAVAKGVGAIEDPAKRTAVAMGIFGRSGAELLPLFRDEGAIAAAEASLGRMPGLLARNAATLDTLDDSFGHLGQKSTQLFVGIADQLAEELSGVVGRLDALDLSGLGQRIGAFVGVAVDAWKAGELDQFIGLTIEAGFDLGVAAAKKGIAAIAGLWNSTSLLNGLLTSVNELMKTLAGGITYLLVPLGAVAGYAFDALEYAFKRAANVLSDVLEGAINKSVTFLNDKLGTSFKTLSLGRENAVAPSFGANWQENLAGRNELQARIDGFFDRSTAAGRDLMGVGSGMTGESNVNGTAAERIGALIQRRLDLREAEAKAAGKTGEAERAALAPVVRSISLHEIERDLRQKLLDLQGQRARLEGNFGLTEAEKYRQRKTILTEELRIITETVARLRERAALENDPKNREQIMSRVDTFERQQAGTNRDLSGLGPDPNSLADQMRASLTEIRNQFGTTAQSIARGFRSVIGSAVDGVAGSIGGLIRGTMTWGDALRNIGSSILNGVIDAIARMFAEWIVGRLAVKGVEIASAGAEAAAKAPGALLTSISSYGVAAALGIAGLVAAMAAISGAFADGGRPPVGRPALVGERGPELFVPDRSGLIIPADRTAAMLKASSGQPVTSQNAVGGQPARTELALFMDQGALNRWVDKHVEAKVVRVLEGRSHQL